jgi:hypothetical protein
MTRFPPNGPNQAYILPPNVKDVLGQDHLACMIGVLSQFARFHYFGEFQGPTGKWVASMEKMIIKMCA